MYNFADFFISQGHQISMFRFASPCHQQISLIGSRSRPDHDLASFLHVFFRGKSVVHCRLFKKYSGESEIRLLSHALPTDLISKSLVDTARSVATPLWAWVCLKICREILIVMRDWIKDETSQAQNSIVHGNSKRDPSAAPSSARGIDLPSHIPCQCSLFS